MAKRRKQRKKRMMNSVTFLALFLLLTGYSVFYVMEIKQKREEKQTLQRNLTKLEQEEVDLKSDYEKLRNPEYVARYAREKYMYSKDGEIIIKLNE